MQNGVCWLCDKPMVLKVRGKKLATAKKPLRATRDHVIPSSVSRDLTDNIRLAHAECNHMRNDVDAQYARSYVAVRKSLQLLKRLRARHARELMPQPRRAGAAITMERAATRVHEIQQPTIRPQRAR